MRSKKEILVFAKRYNKKDPQQIGGAIRLSEELIDDLHTLGESFTVIDINPANGGGFVLSYGKILAKAFKEILSHKCVLFIGSDRVVVYIAPIILLMSLSMGRKFILKKVGGGFDNYYEKSNWGIKVLIRYVMRNAVATLFETKHMVRYFQDFGKTVWFPNVRNIPERKIIERPYSRKFAFISQVKNSKGVIEILKAAQELDNSYSIHLYGPKVDLTVPDHLLELFDTSYQGPLRPEEVLAVIEKYDVIMLPTYYPGEGYPGILIESYSVGKPVISTIWNSIPEIIEHEKTGLLIEPRNYQALMDAIRWFNETNYKQTSKNALAYSKQFNSLFQTSSKLNLIKGYG